MVPSASIVWMSVSLVLIFGFPIALAVYLCVRRKASFLAVAVGALVFLVVQLLVRIPLLQQLGKLDWYQSLASNTLLFVLFLSLTAGLFEETGRYVAFRFLLKDRLETKNALAYGAGHGGFEAIALVGLTYINNLVISLAINNGTFDTLIAPSLGGSGEMVKSQFLGLAPSVFVLGGVERFLTILVHIGMTLLVYYSVRYRRPVFYWLALLVHTALNFGAVMIAQLPGGMWPAEAFVLVFAGLSVWLILRSPQVESRLAPEPAAPEVPAVELDSKPE